MLYKNIFYSISIFFIELFIYFSLFYGFSHTENNYILDSSGINKYHASLIRFNIIILISNIFIFFISRAILRRKFKPFKVFILFISLINFSLSYIFIFFEIHDNYMDVREVSIFPILKNGIFYADIYYCLPALWATIYSIYVYRKITKHMN